MYVLAVTRNKSIAVTTLHSLMTLQMHSTHRNVHTEVIFVEGLSVLPKYVKTGERIVWFDYGTNLDNDSIPRIFSPMEKDVRVLVFPAVTEGVDWNMFKKKTLDGSKEPIHQRGLNFDTDVSKKITGTDLWDVNNTSARVWVMDSNPVHKKLKSLSKNVSCESYEGLFQQVKALGFRIAALPSAVVVRHFTHECLGNILEAPGVHMTS
jgi:hypothetical protein